MNKKISLGAAIAYMAIVAAVAFSLTMIYSMNLFNVKMTGITEREKMYSALHEVDLYVRENYYGTIDEEELQEAISRGYIEGLEDANARYFTAAEYESYTQSGTGRYVGVGLVTELDASGYLLVKEVYPDSPAQMAGIKVGALIINVNGTRVTESNNETMAGRLRGEAGTKVTLTIQQDSQENNYELTLRAIDVPTVKTAMASDGIAYISFTEWNGTTADQFIAQLNTLKAQGVRGILLDVRGITSNELSYAVRIADPLLPSGTVAYSRDKIGSLTAVAQSDANCWDVPMVVLADETTGGTAELLVMALQDFGRAKVVGGRTAGNGDITEIFKLSGGSAIQVTTAQYAGPKQKTFGEHGVGPDYEVELAASAGSRSDILGNAELAAPYKKAMEVLAAAIR